MKTKLNELDATTLRALLQKQEIEPKDIVKD